MNPRTTGPARPETRRPSAPSADLVGREVTAQSGDRLGLIRDVAIDTATGRVAYVILGEGGFLGVGERLHAIPWELLRYDAILRRYVAPLDSQQLQLARAHAAQELRSFREPDDQGAVPAYHSPRGLRPWL